MSDLFAVMRPEKSVAEAESFVVAVCGIECCPPWGNWSNEGATECADLINAAVAARERAAAAVLPLDEVAAVAERIGVAR